MSGQRTETPLLILAGGKGTRLRALEPNRPKPMVLVNGRPFLHWQITFYRDQGHRDFILSTGHMAEIIENHPWTRDFGDCRFRFERETEPLGTGGAVKAIFEHLKLENAWVINGDTLLPQPLPRVDSRFDAVYCVLEKTELFDATPNLHVKDAFVVSEGPGGQYFDGGAVFVTKKAIVQYSGPVPCSLHAVLERAMKGHRVTYHALPGTCYDIGTPERFKRFEDYIKDQHASR